MEKKNLIHTEQVTVRNRNYYLDLKIAENGRYFLAINRTRANEEGVVERAKMILFEEDLFGFSQALMRAMVHFPKSPKEPLDQDYVAKVRQVHPNAFQRWDKQEEELLKELSQQGHYPKPTSDGTRQCFCHRGLCH